MKTLGILISLMLVSIVTVDSDTSIFDFELHDIDGNKTSLEQYKGNVLLIVNTASECGYTPQYEGLQAIFEKYNSEGLVVVGFPANNFGGQEPGTNEEIKEFCRVNYDVSFPMFSKISVKGEDIHPLFDFLTDEQNPDFTGKINWNFEKFLVDRNGTLIHRFRSKVTPESDEIINAIESALNS